MSAAAHSGWRAHVAGLALAGGLVALVVAWTGSPDEQVNMPDDALTYPLHGYLDNYQRHPRLASMLARTLADGSSIVLMGSSELTTADHPAKPVNFFNQRLGRPLLALGHAGNQSFSIHAQLLAADTDLTRSRIAILVSPSWFVDRAGRTGTELAAFLEYQPSPSLYRIHRRVQRGDTLARPVSRYMAAHAEELGSAQPIALWLARNGSTGGRIRYAFSQPWNAAVIAATAEDMLSASSPVEAPLTSVPDTAVIDWEALYAESEAAHRAQCTNNQAFVNDAYYAEHVQGRIRRLEVLSALDNRELRDFRALADFLQSTHAKPLFILQPLNGHVYGNLGELDPLMEEVQRVIADHGFACYDLWTSDADALRPGTLTDVMHLGALGWYRVDSALNAYFHVDR